MSGGAMAQLHALLLAVPVGFALGLLYDLIRPVRRRAAKRREFCLDLLYWMTVGVAVFLCAPILAEGYVRISLVVAHGAGALLYFKLFSRPIRALFGLVERGITRVFLILFYPFRRIGAVLTARLSTFFQHLQKTAKKIFSFPLRWFRMKRALKRERSKAAVLKKEGMTHAQNQKGWSCD